MTNIEVQRWIPVSKSLGGGRLAETSGGVYLFVTDKGAPFQSRSQEWCRERHHEWCMRMAKRYSEEAERARRLGAAAYSHVEGRAFERYITAWQIRETG